MAQLLSGGRGFELKRIGLAIVGTLIYAVGMNLFVVPAALYSGGVMGFSQIIRTLLTRELGLSFRVDIAATLYYIFNVPILILAWRKLDRSFVLKTLLAVSVMTVAMTLIPVTPVLSSDPITSCRVGAVIAGCGGGLVLRAGGTLGGFDLVSLMIIQKRHEFSVGRISLCVNAVVYGLCMLLMSVPTAIYSLVFSFICTTTIDRVHLQNKDSEVTVYTKRSAEAMEQAILSGLQRGVTLMHGTGAYTGEDVNVLTITLSEYELPMLRQLIARFDPHAFVVVKPRVKVFGNYLKKL